MLWVCAAAPAVAEFDSFGLGDGRTGALVVSDAGTILNACAPVLGGLDAGQLSVPVAATSGFAAGDLVMILQMEADMPVPDSGVEGPVDVGWTSLGQFEFARVARTTSGSLELTAALVRPFPGRAQAIRVPEFSSLVITDGGSITAAPWDGSAGGVVALLVTGALQNDGAISADAKGSRGGRYLFGSYTNTTCSQLDAPFPDGAAKGEGASLVFGTVTGRGNLLNGGGGGSCLAPGAGGGHRGQGGRGQESGANEGLGGAALQYPQLARLVFGGGGGASVRASGCAAGGRGGAGGGVVFIRAGLLQGGGRVSAEGGKGVCGECSCGGAGAGGAIHLRIAGSATCQALSVRGGDGAGPTYASGASGAGGGGSIVANASAFPSCPTLVSAGVSSGGQPTSPYQTGYFGSVLTVPGGFLSGPAPVVTSPVDGSSVARSGLVVEGSTAPGTTVHVALDGLELLQAPELDGGFSATLAQPLSVGPHVAQAVSELNGVFSPWSNAVRFTVADFDGGSAGGQRPSFVSTPNTSAFCGTPYRYSGEIQPEVSGAGPFTFWVRSSNEEPLPSGLTVVPTTGEFRWSPTVADVGRHEVELNVESPVGTARQTFTIQVECRSAHDLGVGCSCNEGFSAPWLLAGLSLLGRLRRRAPA